MMLQTGILVLVLLGLSSALVCPDGATCEERGVGSRSAGGVLAPTVKAVICEDQESECPDDTTCCQLVDGSWGCCPLAKAVCCEDKLHCCPEGTKCDLAHSKCVSSSPASFPMLRKLPARRRENSPVAAVGSVTCPGGNSSCPDAFTCCLLATGDYGCCPYSQAVCCSDRVHCCPEGTECDVTHSACVSAGGRTDVTVAATTELVVAQSKAAAVPCNDSVACADGSTCCKSSAGEWACCPLPKAVCCEDHLHCCPHGTICNLAASTCDDRSGSAVTPWLGKVPAFPLRADNGKCDEKTSCPEKSTCCKEAGGGWACCPLPQAVCCDDHLHCCPHGTVCNVAADTCDDPAGVSPPLRWVEKVAALTSEKVEKKWLECNETTSCPDKSTCCKEAGGGWACCPLPQAVCCDDHLHCCPNGTVCNVAADTCDDPAGVSPPLRWVEKVAALTSEKVEAPWGKCDEKTSCPDKSTCCKEAGGGWACCPLPQAVCCDDHLHCCPHGTVCNVAADTCDDPAGVSPPLRWVEKVAALTSEKVEEEKCDKQTMCPGGTTCCRKDSGQWACCPLPQAVCCNDHEHCCPKGSKCNLAEQTCDQPGGLSLPWLKKVPALQKEAVSSPTRPDRNACDARTSCPKDATCCFMDESRTWGCCPLPKAVCCADGNHCCPSGHTCEPHRSSCSRGPDVVIPWFTKRGALTEPAALTDVKCDDKSSCASGTTCCKLQTGEWGCCPLVKAVCCADHEHCCPQGYSCNMQTGTCEKKSHDALVLTLPQSEVARSEPGDAVGGEDAPCDAAGTVRCPARDTCCQVSATEWACCPSPRAVCCSDSKHCCPAGHSCDPKAGGCTPNPRLTWDALIGDRKKDFVQRGL